MLKMRLQRLGYRVEAATDPVEALENIRKNPDRFDLVVTDLSMMVLSGTDAYLVKPFSW
jgi:CheY-like chemotaxis protein